MHILWVICSYLIGSIPFGLLISTKFCNIDPRIAGSNNVGSTNVARLCGKKYGIATLVCDILKGALPVAIATCFDSGAFFITMTALAAILGHVFSCFLGFKGGKAVATSVGIYIPIAFCPLLVGAVLCLGVIWRSGYVSLGSLVFVLSMPVLLLFAGEWALLPLSIIIAALVIWTHRANIQRLICHTEKTWKKKEYKE